MKKETKMNVVRNEDATKNPANVEGTVKEATPQPQQPTMQQIKMMQKQAAQELADYKRRLRESVELKRLQVEELELSIQFYEAKVKFKEITPKIQEMEAEAQAEEQEMIRKQREKINTVKVGTPRTEEEIKAANDELSK